jgi:hypothetical protein
MTDKRYRVNFQCPNPDCDSITVEEVMVEVSQFSPITDIIPCVVNKQLCYAVDYGNCSYGGGIVLHYACPSCGYILHDSHEYSIPISEDTELFEWLKRHNMLEEV